MPWNLAVGYLHGWRQATPQTLIQPPELPWNSDELSAAVGVDPPHDERHTAMGDAIWAMTLYDRITGESS